MAENFKIRSDSALRLGEAEESKKPTISEPRDQHLPIWDRKIRAMEARGTTPRDLFDKDPFGYEMSEAAKEHVTLWWASDIILKRRPFLRGFNYDLYEPVTDKEVEEFGLKLNTKDRTPEGYFRVGNDAILYWAPKKLRDEQMKYMRGPTLRERMEQQRGELKERMMRERLRTGGDGTGPMQGELIVSKDINEVREGVHGAMNVGMPLS